MAVDVRFLTGTQEQYNGLEPKDTNALYFLTDVQKIMKGSVDYTSSVIFADSFPESGQIQGKLYIVGTTGQKWNGTGWDKVFEQAVPTQIVNDLTTGGASSALSAEQGKVLKGQLDTHTAALAGVGAGHVLTGGDVEIADGIITVKKIGGEDFITIQGNLEAELAKKANLAGATFTGAVKVPTPTDGTDAATKDYVDGILKANDAMVFKGTIGTGGDVEALPTAYNVGWTYRVIEAGTYAGFACEVGDLLIAMVERAEGGQDDDWTVAQTNIDGAVVGPASATDDTLVLFNGTSGKQIKASTITATVLSDAIAKAHEHTNKTQLDTYDKTQTELLEEASTAASGLLDAHEAVLATTEQAGHIKLGSGATDAAPGNHNHALASLVDVDTSGLLDGQVVYWSAGDSKWKVKTIASVDISGKMDKIADAVADQVILSQADGSVKMSGKTIGGATLSSSPNANTLATEAAVNALNTAMDTRMDAVEASCTWGTIA